MFFSYVTKPYHTLISSVHSVFPIHTHLCRLQWVKVPELFLELLANRHAQPYPTTTNNKTLMLCYCSWSQNIMINGFVRCPWSFKLALAAEDSPFNPPAMSIKQRNWQIKQHQSFNQTSVHSEHQGFYLSKMHFRNTFSYRSSKINFSTSWFDDRSTNDAGLGHLLAFKGLMCIQTL